MTIEPIENLNSVGWFKEHRMTPEKSAEASAEAINLVKAWVVEWQDKPTPNTRTIHLAKLITAHAQATRASALREAAAECERIWKEATNFRTESALTSYVQNQIGPGCVASRDAILALAASASSPHKGDALLNETGGARLLPNGHLGCIDCGEQYGSLRFPDLVIDEKAFAEISPNPPDGGLICPNCINARLERAGFAYGTVRARFTSGPMAEKAAAPASVTAAEDVER